jgi:protein TonB
MHAAIVFALIQVTAVAGADATDDEEVVAVMVPIEEAPEPPPPPPPPRIETPVVRAEDVQGFQTLSVPDVVIEDIPPPTVNATFDAADFSGVGIEGGRAGGTVVGTDTKVEAGDASAAPVFTPFTVAPRLINPDDVARALERTYPPLLRDAGIGGEVVMWFFIDENGAVVRTQVNSSSGYPGLDEAAVTVSGIMRFTPAFNRDKEVQVWVPIPIRFATR